MPTYESGSDRRFLKWTLEITLPPDQAKTLLDAIQKQLSSTPVFPSSSEIGGKVAGDTQVDGAVCDAGQHGHDRALRLDPLSERVLRHCRGRGLGCTTC